MLGGVRPKVHHRMPARLQDLVARCWAPNYSQRPSFIEIEATMQQIIATECPSLAATTTTTTTTTSINTASLKRAACETDTKSLHSEGSMRTLPTDDRSTENGV